MIKKIVCILFAIMLLHQVAAAQEKNDQRTVTTRIADLLAQLPAGNAKQWKGNMQEITQLGEEGYVVLISGLSTPGKGSNALIEYAISGFSAYVTQQGQEDWRKMSVKAYCSALDKLTDLQNKAFIISQLELVGKDDAVACLEKYVTDPALTDAASRALVKINTAASKQALINALSRTEDRLCQLSIIESLGHTGSKEAAKAIVSKLAGAEENLRKVSLFALANIADPASEDVLAAAAGASTFTYENTNATAAYLLYAEKLMQHGNRSQANAIAKELWTKVKANDQVYIRIAALKLLADYSQQQAEEYLPAAIDDPSFEYRAAALRLAIPQLTAANTGLWLKKMTQTDVNTQIAIVKMLGESNSQTALPDVLKLLRHKDASLRAAAVSAAVQIGQAAVLENLLKMAEKGNPEDISTVSKALLIMKGEEVASSIAAYLPKASPSLKVALIHVLGSRAANAQLSVIYAELKSKNPEVRKAAFKALKHTVTTENLSELYALLKETNDQAELTSIQEAVIASFSGAAGKETQVAMVLQQLSTSEAGKKIFYYKILASLGGEKALAAVSAAFNEGNETEKTAALEALAAWNDEGAAAELIKVARQSVNEAYVDESLKGYLRLIRLSSDTPEQKLLMLRNAMEVARTIAQKTQILKDAGQAKTFNTLVFVGKYLDDTSLEQTAAHTLMNVTLAGKYEGTLIKHLLNKTIQLIKGADSEYQKEAIRKYLSEMKEEEGFVPAFNGSDLSGWKGLVADPIKRSKMDAATLAAAQEKADVKMRESWVVKDGELHFMSQGDNLATVKKYGDFEMLVDWKIIDDQKGEGDAGIYLRGSPQVQIWDNARVNVGAQVGSGGLYNNKVHPSKPLLVADNKLDEWNTFRILMKGDRVTVYLNGQLVTDNVILENYWNRDLPIFAEEQIELQAHGSPVAYRDIFIKEIPRPKPFELSVQEKKEGYQILFDGTHMHHWVGNTTDYILEDGNIAIRPKPGKGSGGNLFTKEQYSDFIFRFEFQLTPGANNGLGIRAPLEGDAAYEGMELQILDNEAPIYKDLHAYQYHGSIYGIAPAKRGFLKPVGEWNEEEVIVKGTKIKVILNGTVILDADISDAQKNGAIDGKKHPGLLRESGHIGFLGHGSPVQFRHIRIKDLTKK